MAAQHKFNRGSKGPEGSADGVSDRATKIAALRALTQEVIERTARKGFTPKQRQAVHQSRTASAEAVRRPWRASGTSTT